MIRQRGFSLLEVLMAFALLAASLGILIAILSGGLAQVKNASDATEATLHAQSLLDELGVLEPIEAGSQRGDFDQGRYRWSLEITKAEDPVPVAALDPETPLVESVGLQPVAPPVLYRIQLDVDWGEDDIARKLSFVTLRVRYPQPVAGALP